MTISCSQFRASVDEYLDGAAPMALTHTIEQHVAVCEACRAHLALANTLQAQLRGVPCPPPTPDFETRVLRHAILAARRPRRYTVAAGLAAVLAVSLAAWYAVSPSGLDQQVANQDVMPIELHIEEVKHVDLVFHSPVDIQQATITLQLPGNVELAGQGGRQTLQWEALLRKGPNRLTLPLVARGASEGQLMASIGSSGKTKTFYVTVFTKPSQSSAVQVLPAV